MTETRSLTGNAAAQLTARLLPGILTVAAVPVLLKLIGTEAYGVIGLYTTFQVLSATLELGLSTTATREVALNVAGGSGPAVNWRLVRTLEVLYWAASAAIALGLVGVSGLVADGWLDEQELSGSEVRNAIIAGGVAIGLRWPVSLYRGVLDGLQLQVRQSVVTSAGAVLRIAGALPFVAWVYPGIVGFMIWQVWATSVELLVMGVCAWHAIGRDGLRTRFDLKTLKRVWRFATSLTAISVMGAVVSQIDKIVISDRLPLRELGYYTLALTAVGPLPHIAAAVSAAAMPRLTGEVRSASSVALARTYRLALHTVAFFTMWIAFTAAFFPREVLLLWTQSERVASAAAVPLALLAIAYLFNALYALPYTLALAAGRSGIALRVNAASAPIVFVVTYALVPGLGIAGAAAIWLVVMLVYLVIYGTWVHRVLLPRQFTGFLREMAPYGGIGLVIFTGARLVASAIGVQGVSYALLALAILAYWILGGRRLPADVRSRAQALLSGPRTQIEERLRQLKFRLVRRRRYRAQYRVLHPRGYTHGAFAREAANARDLYRDLAQEIGRDRINEFDAAYCHPTWVEVKTRFARSLLLGLPEAFLDHPIVRPQMVRRGWGDLQRHEETYLRSRPEDLRSRFANFIESRVGEPFLECKVYRCSANSLGHLYYLARILETFPHTASAPVRVIEFGGGYGNFARVSADLGVSSTHVVIDFPEFVALQYMFLRLNGLDPTVYGLDGPIRSGGGPIELVPVYALPRMELSGDLFTSHFGLSEARNALQLLIADRGFLGCRELYITGQYTNRQPGESWDPHRPLHDAVGRRYPRAEIEAFPVSWAYELVAS